MAGQKDGDSGRKLGCQKGGRAVASKPAPQNCEHCRACGYTSWMQHLGHLGFSAVMNNNPGALSGLRDKINATGNPATTEMYKRVHAGKGFPYAV